MSMKFSMCILICMGSICIIFGGSICIFDETVSNLRIFNVHICVGIVSCQFMQLVIHCEFLCLTPSGANGQVASASARIPRFKTIREQFLHTGKNHEKILSFSKKNRIFLEMTFFSKKQDFSRNDSKDFSRKQRILEKNKISPHLGCCFGGLSQFIITPQT